MTDFQVKEIMQTYGYVYTKSRKEPYMLKRAALINALSKYSGLSDGQIAAYMKLNRTTILHHRKNHDKNVRYWLGYQNEYAMASRCVVAGAVSYTDDTVLGLNELAEKLTRTKHAKYKQYVERAVRIIEGHPLPHPQEQISQ